MTTELDIFRKYFADLNDSLYKEKHEDIKRASLEKLKWEKIVDATPSATDWIFESPDGGKTVKKRRSWIKESEWDYKGFLDEVEKTTEYVDPTTEILRDLGLGITATELQEMVKLAKTNEAVKKALEQLVLLFRLAQQPLRPGAEDGK